MSNPNRRRGWPRRVVACGLLVLALTSQGLAQSRESGKARHRAGNGTIDLRCGAYCLYVSLKSLGLGPSTYDELEKRLGQPGVAGYSMAQLEAGAKVWGAQCAPVRISLDQLQAQDRPFCCIALIQPHHYVCISDVEGDQVEVVDPPRSSTVGRHGFELVWDGTALLLAGKPITLRSTSSRGPIVAAVCAISLATILVVRLRSQVRRSQR